MGLHPVALKGGCMSATYLTCHREAPSREMGAPGHPSKDTL